MAETKSLVTDYMGQSKKGTPSTPEGTVATGSKPFNSEPEEEK